MKNKKGFTLVEVLAVISILGVVMVLALPSLLSVFQQSKKILSDYEKKSIQDAGIMYITDLDNGVKSYTENGLNLKGYAFKEYSVSQGGIEVPLTKLIDDGYYDNACTSVLCKKYDAWKKDNKKEALDCSVHVAIKVSKENGYYVTDSYQASLSGKDCK